MTTTTLHPERFELLATALEQFPERHCQDDFFGSGDDQLALEPLAVAGRTVTVCATTQDLVGWALALDGRVTDLTTTTLISIGSTGTPVVQEGAVVVVEGAQGPEDFAPLAAELLGLDQEDAELLFFLSQDDVADWPGLLRSVAAGTAVADAVAAFRTAGLTR